MKRSGFTFPEMMIVIVLIAVLISLYAAIRNKEREQSEERLPENHLNKPQEAVATKSPSKPQIPSTIYYLQKETAGWVPLSALRVRQDGTLKIDGGTQHFASLKEATQMRQNSFGFGVVLRSNDGFLYLFIPKEHLAVKWGTDNTDMAEEEGVRLRDCPDVSAARMDEVLRTNILEDFIARADRVI